MNTFTRTLACAAALAAFSPAFCQEEEESADVLAEETAETTEASPEKGSGRLFHTLPKVSEMEGQTEVLIPGTTLWSAAERGRHFPLGSIYRTVGANASLTVEFGVGCRVSMKGEAAFATARQLLETKSRTIRLMSGTISVQLPRNMPIGSFVVAAPNLVSTSRAIAEAPGFTVENPAGEARYTYEKGVDGDVATIRCVTGVLTVRGRHYEIPAMHATDEVRIRTSQDGLFSGLYGVSGDYTLNLDQGLMKVMDFENQEWKIEKKTLAWHLSPLTSAAIHRAVPEIGEKLSVSVMTFDAAGVLKNRCAFSEGRPEINSGELAPASKKEKEELAKKAAEAAAATGDVREGEE